MAQEFSESLLVEQPALNLLEQMGWRVASGVGEEFYPSDRQEGMIVINDPPLHVLVPDGILRSSPREAVLTHWLHVALDYLNPDIDDGAILTALDEITRDRSGMLPVAANREIYQLMKEGVRVSTLDPTTGGQKEVRVQVVDWENPENNHFLAVSQLKIQGPMYHCIPDVIGFVNGLPLVVMEFKKPGVSDRTAFDENLTSYMHPQNGVPALFWYNALLITSNGTRSHLGSMTADWERFFEWKRVESEEEPRSVSLEVMLRGVCDPKRLLDLTENFTLFTEGDRGTVKIVGQNHQVLGVNQAVASALAGREAHTGRGGVFWHTQGSGKSYSMVFFAQKILRKIPGNWTFVVVTDRTELDDQIAETFKKCGAVTTTEADVCHAESGMALRELLKGNHRYVFTLIHKFQTNEALCDRSDVMVLVDEAHRSQYDTLAMNMRAALPNATFVAFTGTPLLADGERTRDIFGDYVSVYDFQQSVEDGATVPLFYENRTPELHLDNPALNDDIYRVIDEAGLDEEAEDRLEKLLGKQYHLLTRDDRLDTVAKDILFHFLNRGFAGKAMVVSIDKMTALRMYDKVRAMATAEFHRVEKRLVAGRLSKEDKEELEARRLALRELDMALIVSPGQNEVEAMRAKGLDILPHRRRMNDEDLAAKFKKPEDRLRLVFVCAMWLTGFDAPSCSTVYLDKPMRNHTLMQTIARANRVYPGKHSGVIVDYANVFLALEKALSMYGTGGGGGVPLRNKDELAEELREAMAEATAFCLDHGVDVAAIEALPVAGMDRLAKVADAVERLISPDERRKDFLAHGRLVAALYRALKPHPAAAEFSVRVSVLNVVAEAIKERLTPAPIDLDDVLRSIDRVLDASIKGRPMVREGKRIDLSKIDFAALKAKFEKSANQQTELEQLKAAIRAQLERMVEINASRIDFLERFEELIEAYNSGSATIGQLFGQLVELTQDMSEEQQRHVREQLTEEELVIFDILTRPAPSLSEAEKAEVKKVAREMLARIRALLVLDWKSRRQTVASVRQEIDESLDALPAKYDAELYNAKCAGVFDHLYQKYGDPSFTVYRNA
jgi:type I restriction enzyme R subunit